MKPASLIAAALALVIQQATAPLTSHADTTLSGSYSGPPTTFNEPVTLSNLVTLIGSDFTFNGPVSGPGGLSYRGSSFLTLGSSNSFAGGLLITPGTSLQFFQLVQLADPTSLGTGPLTITSGSQSFVIFGTQTGSTTNFTSPITINSSFSSSSTIGFYLAGSGGSPAHTIHVPTLTIRGPTGLGLADTPGSPAGRSWTIDTLHLNGSLQLMNNQVTASTTTTGNTSGHNITIADLLNVLPVTINSLQETAPSSLTVASNISLHLPSPSTLSGGITNAGSIIADAAGALGTGAITNSGSLTLNATNAAGVNISGGTLFYNANGAAGGHAISNTALFAGPAVSSLSNGATPDTLSALTGLHAPDALLATLDRGIGGGSSNVSFINLAVIESTDGGLPAVQHLGTNADLTLGLNLSGPSSQPATLGLGTPWAALAAGTYRGILTALSDFSLASGTFVSGTDSSFSIITPGAQPPINVTVSANLSAPLANYSGVNKFLVTSAAILSADNALGSSPVPIDISSTGNLTVTSPVAINGPAFFHQSSTLTIQSPGLTGTGALSRDNQPLTIALANPMALTGAQLSGFIHAGDNILLATDNIQHLDTLDPTVTLQIPATTVTQSGTIALNGGRLQGMGFPATLQGPAGTDLLLSVGPAGATLFGTNLFTIAARFQASGPVTIGDPSNPASVSLITLTNTSNQFSAGIFLVGSSLLNLPSPAVAAGSSITLQDHSSITFASPDTSSTTTYSNALTFVGNSSISSRTGPTGLGPIELTQASMQGTLTINNPRALLTIDHLTALGSAQLSVAPFTSNMVAIGTITGDTLMLAATASVSHFQLTSLIINTGKLILSSPAQAPSTTTALTVNGVLDLNQSSVIINPTANRQTVLSTLVSKINAARGTGNWRGFPGITSSTAIADPQHYAVALADNADLALSSFQGTPVNNNSILLTPSHLGDANINGIIDIQDQSLVTNHWQSAQQTWSSGDLNLDGIVDLQDLTLVTNNWQQSSSFPLDPSNSVLSPQSFPLDVPEPSSLLLLTFPLLLLLRHRHHKVQSLLRSIPANIASAK